MTVRFQKCAPLAAPALCLALVLGGLCMPARAQASSFPDVRGHWAETGGWIDYVSAKGLMKGYDNSANFGPDDTLTRGMVAQVLYRIAGGKPMGNPGFKDVDSGAWYYNAVSWCKAKGIITGYPEDGTFRPNAPVLRAELATMVYRFAKWSGASVVADDAAFYATLDTGFIDKPGNAYSYARDALVWTCDRGVLNGKYDNDGYAWLDAQETATRGEAAKIFTVLKRDVLDRSGKYTVSFNSNGGGKVSAQTVTSGNKAARPADPVRKEYTFVNWYSDKALTRVFNFASNVTGNVTAYAKWQVVAATQELEEGQQTEATFDSVEPTYDDVAPVEPAAGGAVDEAPASPSVPEPVEPSGAPSDEPAEQPSFDDVAGAAQPDGDAAGPDSPAPDADAPDVTYDEVLPTGAEA